MSQRGAAPRPAPRRPSLSPPKESASSPLSQPSLPRQDDSGVQPAREPAGAAVSDGDGKGQPPGSRTSGFQNILNPADPRAILAGSSPSASQRSIERSPQSAMIPGQQHGGTSSPSRPYTYPSQGTTTPQPSQQMFPPPTAPPFPPLPADRGSPSATHPFPMAAARRILTPKSPRSASLSRAALRSIESQQTTGSPAYGQRGSVSGHDGSPLSRPPTLAGPLQYGGQLQGSSTPVPPSSGPSPIISRSLSQPMIGYGHHPPPHTSQLPPGTLGRGGHEGRPTPPFSSPQFAHAPMTRGITSLFLGAEERLGIGLEGRHHMHITPTLGEPILVEVDTHKASKVADEKRQRNAGASARFRLRKKEKEKEQQQDLQKLESQVRDLEKKNHELQNRNQELEAQVDFYRKERNRLRDLIARTPGISDWADRGPPSPTPSRAGGSFAVENSPHIGQPPPQPQPQPHQQPHPQPYVQTHSHAHSHPIPHPHPPPSAYGDPAMLERPARRRRTESEPQLATSNYGPNTSTSLPPIPTQGYSIPPSPRLGGAAGAARLPPLRRFDQPAPISQTPPPTSNGPHPPPPSQGPADSHYPSYGKAAYGAGWATGPRGAPESGPR